jgi:glycosyltransferase involved in cell wall biosynthesis
MKNTKQSITCAIIAKDEEEKIGECIDSLKWVDEVLLVDTGSSDKTIEITKKRGAKIVEISRGSYADWRNEALKHVKSDWIFYVDADERVTPALRDEIGQLISEPVNQLSDSAHAIPRRNLIFGKEFKHGGQYPDYQKRLFLRSRLKGWTGKVHEEPEFEGNLGHLKNSLLHIKHNNLSEMVQKTNNWSAIEAELMYKSAHPRMNVFRFLTAMWREFWLRMVKQMAFLDGVEGIIYANYQVFSKFVSYAKLWEMQIKNVQQVE